LLYMHVRICILCVGGRLATNGEVYFCFILCVGWMQWVTVRPCVYCIVVYACAYMYIVYVCTCAATYNGRC